MGLVTTTSKTYTLAEVAADAGVSTRTVTRWWKAGRIKAPLRNRRNWSYFTHEQRKRVLAYARTLYTEAELQEIHRRHAPTAKEGRL